jgi:hypothetical protein
MAEVLTQTLYGVYEYMVVHYSLCSMSSSIKVRCVTKTEQNVENVYICFILSTQLFSV